MAEHLILDTHKQKGNIILNEDIRPSLEEAFLLISILETYLSMINRDMLYELNTSFRKLTLFQLAKIYKMQDWYTDSGFSGKTFERLVYNSIVCNQEYIIDYLLEFIYDLDGFKSSDNIHVLLWGPEKGVWVKDKNLNLGFSKINNDDIIEIKEKIYNFKDLLDEINMKNTNHLGFVGKADLFIKQDGSRLWHSVTIKSNYEDLTLLKFPGIHIGIALSYKYISNFRKYKFSPIPSKHDYIFVFPRKKDFGVQFSQYLKTFNSFLSKITHRKSDKWTGYFDWSNWLIRLSGNIHIPVYELLDELDERLKYYGIVHPKRIHVENTPHTFLLNGENYSASEDSEKIITIYPENTKIIMNI